MKRSEITYPDNFLPYIKQVAEDDLAEAFSKQAPVIKNFLSSVCEETSYLIYAPGTWTVKEVLQHIIDTERILCYRALSFARKEEALLPGFDGDDYVASANANQRSWQSLASEFLAVRQSTQLLFNSFTGNMLYACGKAGQDLQTVAAIGFTIVGHFYHHKKIVEIFGEVRQINLTA
jgi:hypothetical protein